MTKKGKDENKISKAGRKKSADIAKDLVGTTTDEAKSERRHRPQGTGANN